MLNLKRLEPPTPRIVWQPPPEWLPRLRQLLEAFPQADLSSTEALCCRIVGDFTAGIVLHRLLYWLPRGSRSDAAIWKSDREWYAELNLSYAQMQRVRARLSPIVKSWVERAQGAPTYHYQLRIEKLVKGIAVVLDRHPMQIRVSLLDRVENGFSAESKDDFRESLKSLTNQHQDSPIDERLNIYHPYQNRFVGFTPAIADKLASEYARIGESNVRAVLERCDHSAGKSWQYVLRSLENVSAQVRTPIPLYEPPAPARADEDITAEMRLAWASCDEGRSWAARLASARNPQPAAPVGTGRALSEHEIHWDRAYGQLEIQLDRASFDTWLRATRFLKHQNGVYHIAVPNDYARDMLQHRMYRDIRRVLMNVTNVPVELQFETRKPAPVQEEELPAFKLLALENEAQEAEMAFYKSLSRKEAVNDVDSNPDRAGLGREMRMGIANR